MSKTLKNLFSFILIVVVLAGVAAVVLDEEGIIDLPGARSENKTLVAAPADGAEYTAHEWSVDTAPAGYAVYGTANVSYDVAPGEYLYSPLDEMGRTQAAVANITAADFAREQNEEREEFSSDADKISSWGHNAKLEVTFPNDHIYHGYFYNRSHLIADSLGGSPARENLVCGTRFQNVGGDNNGGMAYTENLARTWLASAGEDETLYYAVTPVYVEDELVPRSVYVDIRSSDGDIDKHVEVFNVSGDITGTYEVDYATGEILENGIAMK